MKKKLDFTKQAKDQIDKITEGQEKKYFRITVQGGGCSGFKYNFGFDKQTNEDDILFRVKNLILNKVSGCSMTGIYLDILFFSERLLKKYFTILSSNE